tara:strand:+ start:236 stop:715 length:480 start_codon:yes stop_codon:yes gene_type:complete
MNYLKSVLLSFLTIFFLSSCASDSNVIGENIDKNYLSSLPEAESDERETIWDAFNREATREPVKVNRYIWQAALDVLDFMPIETIDPFSGVIVKGFGVPPGGKTQYRATIYVVDPALEARSLRVSMQTKAGPVSTATMKEIENAILSRARQMRKADGLS